MVLCFSAFVSCENCESNPNRPEIPEDGMKWVEVNNKTPKFKITIENSDGTTTIDTIQGEYTLTVKDGPQAEDECEKLIRYKIYENFLSLPLDSNNYGSYFKLDNYLESGYRGQISGNPALLDENTSLDTALVSGILYHDVYKEYAASSYIYFYSKNIGFILLKKIKPILNTNEELYSIELIQ